MSSYVSISFHKETPSPEGPGIHLSSAHVKAGHTIVKESDGSFVVSRSDWAMDLEVPSASVKSAFRQKAQPAKK